ncbi:NifU family protein [Nocardioides sp.]|uniref:NifU family protein n=1 Tax=Nocardioides sp. TaxID=35761 RepID=UPI003D1516FC
MSEESTSQQADQRLIAVEELFDREIRPLLASHLGGANVTGIDDQGAVQIEFTGACTVCAFRRNTIVGSIYPRLRHVEGVNSVSTPGVAITVQQQHRMAAMYDNFEARAKERAEQSPSHHECHSA